MAGGYIIVDPKTRNILIPCAIVAAFLFVIGVLIGYFSAPSSDQGSCSTCNLQTAITGSCPVDRYTDLGKKYLNRYLEKDTTSCIKDASFCNTYKRPRNYIAYHLSGKQVTIDGKLDEEAWQEVPWSEMFVDMRSEIYPKPYLDTKVKIRWDDTRLYVGAYIQETNLWATFTQPDSQIWRENGFEMLMDVDGTMFNYKQMQINVLGTMLDQVLFLSPHDAATRNLPRDGVKLKEWHAGTNKAVYAEGTINTPGDTDKYWTAEMSFTFEALAANSTRSQQKPNQNEVWFINFGRSEQALNITQDNRYVKAPGVPLSWWSWQPCDAINLHLQDRWGLVQFKANINDKQFNFENWHIYRALFDVMDAEKKYKALNAKYTDQLVELPIPPYLLSQTCVEIPEVALTKTNDQRDFLVTVKSKLKANVTAHIRSDRYVTFD